MSSPGPWGTVLHSVPKAGWGHYDVWRERWLSPYTPLHFQLRYSLGKENGMIVLEGERGGNRGYLLPILSNSNLHQPMFGKIIVPWLFSDSEQSASTIFPITQSWELELPHMWPCSHMHVPIDWHKDNKLHCTHEGQLVSWTCIWISSIRMLWSPKPSSFLILSLL